MPRIVEQLSLRFYQSYYSIIAVFHRLSKKEAELHDETSNRVSEWGSLVLSWKEWLKIKENELDSQGAVGIEPNVIKTQQAALEVRPISVEICLIYSHLSLGKCCCPLFGSTKRRHV